MSKPDWDDLRLFLAAARAGSLMAAGRSLGLDHTTVSRRLVALERTMGAVLLERSPRGVALTAAGAILLTSVERIEAAVSIAAGEVAERDAEIAGAVRLATPEAFGTFLVAPNIAQLMREHPKLEFELAPRSRAINPSKREADIAVTLRQPSDGRLVARRLVDYAIGVYASREYLARTGTVTLETLPEHRFISYIDELIDMPELRFRSRLAPCSPVGFRSSSIAAQQAAVAAGAGLGALHVFAARRNPDLVRILADTLEVRRSYWLVIHADQRRLPRIRAVIDFLDRLIEANRHAF
jgi:DNA-binding transcriptional LysR family regulator